MAVLGSILNAGAQLATTAMSINAAKKQQEREYEQNINLANMANDFTHGERLDQNAWNAAEAEKARQWDYQMWQEQNEYNSPAAQMERLISSGLNANTAAEILGGGGAGNAASIQTSAAAGANNGSGAMGSVPSVAGQIGNTIANSANTFWQNELIKNQAKGEEIKNGTLDEINRENIKVLKAQGKKLEEEGKFTKLQRKVYNQMSEFLIGKTRAEVEQLQKNILKTEQEIENLKQQQKNLEAQEKNTLQDTELKHAQTDLTKSQDIGQQKENKLTDEEIKREVWKNKFRDLGIDPDSSFGSNALKLALEGKLNSTIESILKGMNGGQNPNTPQDNWYNKPFSQQLKEWNSWNNPLFKYNPFYQTGKMFGLWGNGR